MPKSTPDVVAYDPLTGGITKNGRLTGTVNAHGYVVLRLNGKVVYAHRLAWLLYHGVEPEVIDHKNGRVLTIDWLICAAYPNKPTRRTRCTVGDVIGTNRANRGSPPFVLTGGRYT